MIVILVLPREKVFKSFTGQLEMYKCGLGFKHGTTMKQIQTFTEEDADLSLQITSPVP